MSHFYGVLNGQAQTSATRCGSKNSGMVATAASWDGAIRTEMYYDEISGKNMFVVTQTTWRGAGINKVLARGVVGEK